MRIHRLFTKENDSPYSNIEFRKASSEIKNPDGSVVFRLDDIDVPADWSQVACDVLAQKYFRKAGVPKLLKKFEENDVPSWLWRRVPDIAGLAELPEDQRMGSETGARQVFDRMAGTWAYWGWKGGYFDSEQDARDFVQELGLTYQFATDNMAQITLEYRLAYFPTTIFIDKAGRLFRSEISVLHAEKITRIVRDMS